MTINTATNTAIRDKVIVITGGARGIGFATATALHNLGAKVAIGDVDEAKLKESAADLALDVYGKLDVTDADAFATFLDAVERRIAAAGSNPACVIIKRFLRRAHVRLRRRHHPSRLLGDLIEKKRYP